MGPVGTLLYTAPIVAVGALLCSLLVERQIICVSPVLRSRESVAELAGVLCAIACCVFIVQVRAPHNS